MYISDILNTMKKESRELKNILRKSQNILILTHKGPDFDAFCSALILKEYINTYYPRKNVVFKSRQTPTQNIPHMEEIQIVEEIHSEGEDLIILTDSSDMRMCTTTKDTIKESSAKIVIIDHHDTATEHSDLSINNNMSSATEQVLSLCMDMEGRRFKISESISMLGQIGIITDTGRFLFENTTPQTYEIMSKLRAVYHFDIEEFTYKNSKFPYESLLPLQKYIQNIHIEDDMAYTYISEEDIKEVEKVAVNSAQRFIRDRVIRYIHGIHWGFVVKPSYYKENIWQVSLRGTKGYQKVDKIAELLGGGGHEYSAAARVEAEKVEDVVNIVLDVIKRYLSSQS